MGKKILSQVKVKTCKVSSEKKRLMNSLIKVLRPKVYITDNSNFKSLVQQLTGNGTSDIPSEALSSSPSFAPQIVEKFVPVVDVGTDGHGNLENSSMKSSFGVSLEPFQQADSLNKRDDLQPLLQLDGDSIDVYSQIQQELSIYD
ncbi:hypothetical protein DITRI_Ditri13aG0150700 [Diplodiscus trichospermus]